ncbi:ABC transporter ATP-binding protein [Ketogulonicigenium vulgare]|uniref:ABC transporter ATP-binding protein n=1 Tax=Ketogulonicigenium vulgare TaxID=92945 RepID=UPI002358BB09|nr:ABC transporter ATP-binding protein [Ketogulonicigenium vulgare]
MIEIRNLTKSFGDMRAVDDVSLRLDRGSITAIVGTSGSGKSTLLRMVNRLVEPDGGEVLLNGQSTRSVPQAALCRQMGYVIQDHGLFPHWTVRRNIGTVPQLLGWQRARIDARVDEVMRLLQLDPSIFAGRYPHELSGGQSQRVGVARAIAAAPDVLLMDEPFGALDPVIRADAQQVLRDVHRASGTTILMVTHDMGEAMLLADRIAVMDAGRIVQCDAPDRIITHPANAFVRALITDSERAFRHLALLPAAPLITDMPAAGEALPRNSTLAAVLAAMIWSGRSQVPMADDTGQVIGSIELSDVIQAGRPT